MVTAPLTPDAVHARHIRGADMVACAVAFIDCRMPGSERKQNYSLIGPGVTQSHDQVVNLSEPHGFSLGVAAMPPGTVNNLHVHFTAEVFMVHKGQWTFRWGDGGKDGTVEGGPSDVVSLPTWIFRGFTNSGNEDGWIFTALGGDDTGGIIWHPSILENAARYGMYLTQDNMLVDTTAGQRPPEPEARMAPLSPAQVAALPRYTSAEMAKRVVRAADRAWSSHALVCSSLPGMACELASAIGFGMTEDRAQTAPIPGAHGFSVEWLRLQPGQRVGRHSLAEKQVAIVYAGALDVVVDTVAVHVAEGECYSFPPAAWREATAGDVATEVALITAGDGRKRVTWAPEIVAAAMAAGTGIDHNGYVAPLALMPPPTRAAVAERMMQVAE